MPLAAPEGGGGVDEARMLPVEERGYFGAVGECDVFHVLICFSKLYILVS